MGFTDLKAFKIGRVGEDAVRKLLDWAGVDTSLNNSDQIEVLKKHDIHCEMNGVQFSIEVKTDRMESVSKNIAIEYANPITGKPSGLMSSAADLWAIVLNSPDSIWVCSVKDLKAYFETETPVKDIKRAGDGNASIRVYRSSDFLNRLCLRLDGIPPWDVLAILSEMTKRNGAVSVMN